jgi:hypothetical protein
MKKSDYRIESLASIFGMHADEAEKNYKESVEHHLEAFPDSDLPEWMADDFNLARALSVMAAEIERLKIICN